MTVQFSAHFENGVLVPDETVELPAHKKLKVSVEVEGAEAPPMPRNDDPDDPMPEGGVAMIEWWSRHALPMDPVIGDKIARSKAYEYYEEPDDDA